MRMRKKKNGEARIAACSEYLITLPEEKRGAWKNLFPEGEKAQLHLEIGCGKGGFLCRMAQKFPEINFIGLEFCREALITALEQAKREEIKNIVFVNADAAKLPLYFAEGEIDKIYLNFSDPWPKSRHAKRRLTAPSFLASYRLVLKKGGVIRQKTDNVPLFDFSLESYAECGWTVKEVTRDLHHSPENADNVMTEYETAFSSRGIPICAVTAYFL